MKKGTPAGTQLDCAVKALFFPASIWSMSCFMRSFTHGIRFGLERSAIRKLGCAPAPLATKGCAGSLIAGGRRPGTGSKNGPPPLSPTQPVKFDEKSGGGAFCATGDEIGAPRRATRRPPARTLHVNADIVAPP